MYKRLFEKNTIQQIVKDFRNTKINFFNFENDILLFHGTSFKNLKKIIDTKYLLPALADNEEYGKAIWLTPEFTEAKQFGNNILAIKYKIAKQYKNKIIGVQSNEYLQKLYGDKSINFSLKDRMFNLGFLFLILEKVSINDLYIIKSNKIISLISLKNDF